MTKHIDVTHLERFVLGGEGLSEEEETHLLHCSECRDQITEVTLNRLSEIYKDDEFPFKKRSG